MTYFYVRFNGQELNNVDTVDVGLSDSLRPCFDKSGDHLYSIKVPCKPYIITIESVSDIHPVGSGPLSFSFGGNYWHFREAKVQAFHAIIGCDGEVRRTEVSFVTEGEPAITDNEIYKWRE